MDGKGSQKIKKYLVIYLIFAVLFSGFMCALAGYENSVKQEQMLALMAGHPELEAQIIALLGNSGEDAYSMRKEDAKEDFGIITEKYGYEPKAFLVSKGRMLFWAAGMLLGVFGIGLAGYLNWRRQQKSAVSQRQFQELYECLEEFQRGNFRNIWDYENASEEWMRIWESLRELGLYFEGLKGRLKEEEESTKALITDISHQLKTPLASLRMSYELVAGDNLTQEERREFQEQEEKEIEKLEMLLSELVNLSRLETRMIQIKPVMTSLKETVTEAVSRIYVKARNKDIDICVEMEGDFNLCHDAKWTEEALKNVLENAVKYSKEHTIVTVRVLSLIHNVLIEIEDEGMGIREDELAKIYQRFYRGEEAKENVKEGTGVGLYLTRMILERQGGTISAKRKRERGTVFRITLPC